MALAFRSINGWLWPALLACGLLAAPLASPVPAQEPSIVFYSGFDTAGITHAEPWADVAFVHSREAEWPSWRASTECDPRAADNFSSGPNTLVGWSIGRQGPIWFLATAPDRWDEIDTIWLLDPGTRQRMTSGSDGNCDPDLPRRASGYLSDWLEGGLERRLVVLSGALSEEDDRAGLNEFYLNGLTSFEARSQTFLCRIDPGSEVSNHDNRLVQFFLPSTVAAPTCPDRTTRIGLPADASDGEPATTTGPIGQQISTSVYAGLSGRQGSVARLYGAVFERLPELSGFQFWTTDNRSIWAMASFFVMSREFQQTYGSLSDDQFLVEVYRNVLGRSPDGAGLDYWRARLGNDLDRAAVVVLFSDSAEFRAQTATS